LEKNMSNKTLGLINTHEAKWVDFRFTDTKGKEQHVSFPAATVDEETFVSGKMFDGSSIAGWKGIEASDMILMPDAETSFMDPFFDEPTVVVTCDVIEPNTMQGYERDPRSIAKRAEAYLKATGIGDTAFFGPEPEFFVFDEVKWKLGMSGVSHELIAEEAAWSTNNDYEGGNTGHRPRVKGGYFPVPPVDSGQDLRVAMCNAIEAMMGPGRVEVQHHEVASCQSEIGVSFNTLVRKADEVQVLKYAVLNTAHAFGKTATFMPKPMVGDNGSGMHVHMSISKDGKNLFCRRPVRRSVRNGPVLHRRRHQARPRPERHYQPGHQLLQASGAALRSSDQAGLLRPQPFGFHPYSVRVQPEGQAH
jgi:glutamine synthetase